MRKLLFLAALLACTAAQAQTLDAVVHNGNTTSLNMAISAPSNQDFVVENTATLQSAILRPGNLVLTAPNNPSFQIDLFSSALTSNQNVVFADESGVICLHHTQIPITVGDAFQNAWLTNANIALRSGGGNIVAGFHRVGGFGEILLRDGVSGRTCTFRATGLTINPVYEVANNSGKIPAFIHGIGNPNGVVSAVVGTCYINDLGGANQTLWIKETGSGSSGWAPK